MKILHKIVIFVLAIIPTIACAGWTRLYGGEDDDVGRSVRQTSDGGYIIAGATASYGDRFGSLWLLKTDSLGDTLWAHTYGRYEGSFLNMGSCVQETHDKGFIITGVTVKANIVFSTGYDAEMEEHLSIGLELAEMDLWLVKMDSVGKPKWEKTHGRSGIAGGEFVNVTSDGGYIVTGFHTPSDEEWPGIFLIKTDEKGITEWKETYSSPVPSFGYCTQQTRDGNYITCGVMGEDVCIIKSDPAGQIVWTQLYGGRKMDVARYLQETTDGGFIMVGETYSFGVKKSDIWLLKTDKYGDTLWSRIYGGRLSEFGRTVRQTPDGGYIIAGSTNSFGRGRQDIWLLKTDSLGDTLWTKTYGWRKDEEAFSLDLTKDGGYIITGYKKRRAEDIWLLKTDAEGDTL
jgi:hypothetical protein